VTVIAFFMISVCLSLAVAYGYWRGLVAKDEGRLKPLSLPPKDPLLREAEAEVEALLGALPPDEQAKKRPLLLPSRQHRHPRLPEMTVRAIAGLMRDGYTEDDIRSALIRGVRVPCGSEHPRLFFWSGDVLSDGAIWGDGKWQRGATISPCTWAYLRRSIEQRPDRNTYWLFQDPRGYQLPCDDILLCADADESAMTAKDMNDGTEA
jgi:hypothetical protein